MQLPLYKFYLDQQCKSYIVISFHFSAKTFQIIFPFFLMTISAPLDRKLPILFPSIVHLNFFYPFERNPFMEGLYEKRSFHGVIYHKTPQLCNPGGQWGRMVCIKPHEKHSTLLWGSHNLTLVPGKNLNFMIP